MLSTQKNETQTKLVEKPGNHLEKFTEEIANEHNADENVNQSTSTCNPTTPTIKKNIIKPSSSVIQELNLLRKQKEEMHETKVALKEKQIQAYDERTKATL